MSQARLRLTDAPSLVVPDGRRRCLPVTRPGGLLVFLAVEARWIERESLARRFWPEREAVEALHKLRANVLRLKAWLRDEAWPEDALQPERSHVRLTLPSEGGDLAAAESGWSAAARDELRQARAQAQAQAFGMAPLVMRADRWMASHDPRAHGNPS